ncbi:MAG: hypothetical protein V3V06_01520, partial [Dehalococcoidia bacterium]
MPQAASFRKPTVSASRRLPQAAGCRTPAVAAGRRAPLDRAGAVEEERPRTDLARQHHDRD